MRARTRATEVHAAFLSARALARMSGLTERVTTAPALCWCADRLHDPSTFDGPVRCDPDYEDLGSAHRVTLHTLTLTAATEEP